MPSSSIYVMEKSCFPASPTNGSLLSNQALPARASLLPNKNSQILHPKLQEESVVISLLFAVSSASAKVKLRKRKSTNTITAFFIILDYFYSFFYCFLDLKSTR